jgi:hypothetical protein
MTSHAPLAPSSADRWYQCARSPSLEAAFPEDGESEAAREGTAAHWYLQQALTGNDVSPGEIAENGVPVTAEMVENVTPLIHEVRRVIEEVALRNGIDAQQVFSLLFRVEQRVSMTAVHPDNWGTCDIFLYDPATKTIHIWDFKYGHGYVDHVRNWQLIDYAQGVIEQFGISPTLVSMTIYQPRCYQRGPALRTWTITGEEHRALVQDLHMRAKLVSPNAAATTGPACKNCKGRVACEANQRMVGNALDVTLRTTSEPLTGRALGAEYATLCDAEERIKARRVGLEAAIKSNPSGTGWVTEQGYGREKWSVPVEQVLELGDMFGLDLRKPDAITPAQARKLGLDEEVSKGYSVKPRGEVKLVRASDSAAARAFSEE